MKNNHEGMNASLVVSKSKERYSLKLEIKTEIGEAKNRERLRNEFPERGRYFLNVANTIDFVKKLQPVLFDEPERNEYQYLHQGKEEKSFTKSNLEKLGKREWDVLELIMTGGSNKEIAAQLFISSKTVEKHRSNIMQKLEVRNAGELMKLVYRELFRFQSNSIKKNPLKDRLLRILNLVLS